MPKILIVHDDAGIRKALKKFLAEEGYETIAAASGVEAERLALSETPALILMDMIMPGRDGREVTRDLRRRGFLRPIIIMSCKSSDVDCIVALEAGADDYVAKPFNNHVLLARIRACLRRWENRENADTVCRSGALVIDFERRLVTRNGECVKLTGTEYDLLHALARKKGEPVSRDDLQRAVWNTRNFMVSRALDVHVRALRRKLEDDPANPRHILTVQGVGYRFV